MGIFQLVRYSCLWKDIHVFFNPTWAEGGAGRPTVKKHAVSQKIFVHFT